MTYVYLASFAAVTVVFAFVVGNTPRQQSKPSLVVAGYLVALWALGDAMSNLAHTPAEMWTLSKAFSPVWAMVPFWLLRAALLYAGHGRAARSPAFFVGGLLPAAVCVFLVLSGRLYVEFVPAGVQTSYFQSRATAWHAFVAVYFAAYVSIAGGVLLAASRRQGGGAMRLTGRLILFGLVPVVIVGLLVNGGLSLVNINPPYLGSVLASGFATAGALGLRREIFFAPLETAQRERDEAREFLSRREQVLEALPAGVVIADASTAELVYRNELAGELLGRSDPARLPDAIAAAASRCRDLGEDQDATVEVGGEARVLSVHARPVRYGTEPALLVALQDVSERKAVERQLQEQRDQLRHAEKMEAIGRLSAGVAHDFNNLMNAVLANAELMQQELGPHHDLAVEVEDILGAVRHGRGLTRQLLAFSRKQAARPEVLDVGEVIESEVRMLRRLLGGEIELSVRAADESCLVFMDRVQLEQVLVTLATNARDAMPGGGRLSFFVEGAPEGVRIEVSDTGVGMSAEVANRVFEPFFSTKGKYGTGLGLATAYGIVTQAGGSITVDSAPSAGTTFTLELPACSSEDAPALRVPEGERLVAEAAVRTVLLVDDDASTRRTVQRLLEAAGMTVVSAASAPEARRLFERDPQAIDLLLTDIVMPEMSGLDLALGLLSVSPRLPVVFLTGHRAQHRDRLGDDAVVVPKPFDPLALVSLAEQLIAQRSTRTDGRLERPS